MSAFERPLKQHLVSYRIIKCDIINCGYQYSQFPPVISKVQTCEYRKIVARGLRTLSDNKFCNNFLNVHLCDGLHDKLAWAIAEYREGNKFYPLLGLQGRKSS